jgi:prephenate dehydratase
LVEDKDTAETARRIQTQQLQGIAAIGSVVAAELFALEVIAPEIQTVNNNLTRFAIVSRQPNALSPQINKASIKFELHHQRGSLAAILNVMSDCRLNLTKIQSLPKIESPFTYAFFVDVTFEDYADFEKAAALLNLMALSFKILGIYQNTLP